MSSSKRARRAESDGRWSPVPGQSEHDLVAILKQFSDTVLRRLDNKTAEDWPKEYEKYLACPFRRRNPARYVNVRDHACTGHGFKDIADLRDHIKRVHSDRYGCSHCRERYQCRDKYLAEHEKKHKGECKRAKKSRLEVSDFKPEWMTPGQDKRYFQLDFRKRVGMTVEAQYLGICEAIWPAFDGEDLNIWSNPGDAVAKCHIAELLEDPELYGPFLGRLTKIAGSRRGAGTGGRQEQLQDYYATEAVQQQPMMANNSSSMRHVEYDSSLSYSHELMYQDESLSSTHDCLQQLSHIPQPVYYADTGPKDSGYWSSLPGDMDASCQDSSMTGIPFDPLLSASGYNFIPDLAVPAGLQRDVYMGGDDLSLNELNLSAGVET